MFPHWILTCKHQHSSVLLPLPDLCDSLLKRRRENQRKELTANGDQPAEMVKVLTYFGMTLAAFAFWQSMDKVHVWIALHQDEKQERLEKEAEVRRVRAELLQKAREEDPLA
ncbi:unnamed protein product [Microthlaspi erraticum]|uniref:Uncharacterized protein n=1 Tax=Microthlaspi erraticum TaxID=1685480 RepID=A0A6D2L0N4_9BRAS|nr:unnamed protein product [Microthlaspi erraticum]